MVAGVIYAFVVLVDPFEHRCRLSPPLDRAPVTTNQRFAYPALAGRRRSTARSSARPPAVCCGPAALDPAFDARFANLAMNDATPYEKSRLMQVFIRAHPGAKVIMLGIDQRWCVTGDSVPATHAAAVSGMDVSTNRWRGYTEMFNLFAVQEAGKEFGVLTGMKAEDMGRDGYTRFVPPDRNMIPRGRRCICAKRYRACPRANSPGRRRGGAFRRWRRCATTWRRCPPTARKILFFVPYQPPAVFGAGQSDGDESGTSASAASP